jgi:hypothetical protein
MANYRLETDSKWNDRKWKMPISYLDKDGNQTNDVWSTWQIQFQVMATNHSTIFLESILQPPAP